MGQLTTLRIRPGLYTDETPVGAEPFWYDCNLVRFRNGIPEQFGGWQKAAGDDGEPIVLQGVPRSVHDWSSLDSQQWAAIGTHYKLYLINGGRVYDITPIRASGQFNGRVSSAAGSAEVRITHRSHGLDEGDFVHLSTDGTGPSGEYQVERVVGINAYVILDPDLQASAVTGVQRVTYEYEISIGRRSKEKVFGYGVGGFGMGSFGTPRNESTLYEGLRTWSLDNWGEDLIANPVDGPVYWWDRSLGPGARARLIEAAPSTNKWISVSSEDRHLVCFGAHTTRSRDPMLVRWSDQENFDDFTPTRENTSGDKRLDAGSRIVTAIDTRGEKLIFTDEAVFSMRFVGGNQVFAFQPMGQSVTIIGQNAAAQVNGVVYFMGTDDFLVYDGTIRTMACPVRNRVFDDINTFQGAKVFAAVNRTHTEIIWFYSSALGEDNDRYVVYNYREQVWYFGSISRTLMRDESPSFRLPYATDPDGKMFLHETGSTADGEMIESYLQSYDIDLGDGQQFMHLQRMIPDFLGIEGQIDLTLISRQFPGGGQVRERGPYRVTPSTTKISVRARNRQIAFRVAAAAVGTSWRMGHWRAELVANGQR